MRNIDNYICRSETSHEKIPRSLLRGVSLDSAIKAGKTIYLSHTNKGKTEYYDGTEWNLNFNVSKEELKIINLKGSFMEKVRKVFRRSA